MSESLHSSDGSWLTRIEPDDRLVVLALDLIKSSRLDLISMERPISQSVTEELSPDPAYATFPG